jgi:4-amino-4-deoxy-L-arabinose transferase-like glycosyltransferase
MNSSEQIQKSRTKHLFPILFGVALISIISILLIYRLNDWPTVFWDEGWTLSATRNWIEHGHLGNYLDGQPVPPRIPLRFPIAVPVAISMKIFGIGIWQGRLPVVIFTILALGLSFYIISKMYDRRTGIATLLLMLCLSPFPIQPIVLGRQLMAEMPMMFYLLGGYSMVWLSLTRSKIWGVGAAIFFGIAIHAKLQVPPFWLASIGLAIWVSVKHRQWRSMKIITEVAMGSIVVAILVYLIQNMIMPGSFANPELLKLLLNTSVITLNRTIRLKAIYIILLFALPEVLGFIWAGRPILRDLLTCREANNVDVNPGEVNRIIMRAAIWGLGASWLVWYATMSLYPIRYLFPAYFIGFIFISAYVGVHTNGFDLRPIFRQTSALILKRELKRQNIKAACVIIIFSLALGFAIGTMRVGLAPSNLQPELAVSYLYDNVPTNARIETFESELLFLAPELNYHFPSDLVSMQLFRRASIDRQYSVNYDPLIANPDFLVVGPYARTFGLYDEKLIERWFELIADVGGYQIYHIKKPQTGN